MSGCELLLQEGCFAGCDVKSMDVWDWTRVGVRGQFNVSQIVSFFPSFLLLLPLHTWTFALGRFLVSRSL